MGMHNFLRACRWYMAAPHRRIGRIFSHSSRLAAVALHPTAELSGHGLFCISRSVIVGKRSKLEVPHGQVLKIGEGAWIGNDCDISVGGRISIGARSSIQNRSQLLGEVDIGAGCVCAPNLYVSSSWHHFIDEPYLPIRIQDHRAQHAPQCRNSKPVQIGDDCWLGINVVVLPGITIGRGCVVGANSVVTTDIPPYSVVAGAPARLVKKRLAFSPPRSIFADRDEHAPYFYAGFQQLGAIESSDRQLQRVGCGWLVAGTFKIALDVMPGTKLSMRIKAAGKGRIEHDGVSVDVNAGSTIVSFLARPERWRLIELNWIAEDTNADHSLVVMSVWANDEAGMSET